MDDVDVPCSLPSGSGQGHATMTQTANEHFLYAQLQG